MSHCTRLLGGLVAAGMAAACLTGGALPALASARPGPSPATRETSLATREPSRATRETSPATRETSLAPLRGTELPGVVSGRYMVVLKTAAAGGSDSQAALNRAVDRAEANGADVGREYRNSIHGYVAEMSAAEVAEVRQDPQVAFVEADRRIRIQGTRVAASWGQDRIDQRTGLDGSLSTAQDGTGVTAYVIDTGIRASHTGFGGRVSSGYTAISDGNGTSDCNGHGTHVAGTIGSDGYGVAPAVSLVAVRVLGCDGSGTTSGVIAGIDWVTAHHASPAVANLSLGGSAYSALDHAVSASIASGVTYAVAAGNSAASACDDSPARVPEALTVAASTSADAAAGFSNYGSCVDLYAPGQGILSTLNTSDTATASYSGTSMASPHVAGAAALYLQAHPSATPAEVGAAILGATTSSVLTGVPSGTPNLLLYVGTTTAPTASPSSSPTSSPGSSPTSSPSSSPSASPTSTSPSASPTSSPGCSAKRSASRLGSRAVATSRPYTTTRSGTHRGCLVGPKQADFDLFLDRWSGSRWVSVAGSRRNGATETVSYTGRAGKYRWRVVVISGSGTFTLTSSHP
jgi:subtilisin family serine protease